ncbi:MAG: DUF5615 family PIN-like protein [Micrococcales bacterium]|nr:DUF5615 family PIN-like protein [Micrococcales bacterium]
MSNPGDSSDRSGQVLLLDEHFPAVVAQNLRAAGFEVHAVVEDPNLVGLSDEALFVVAAGRGWRIVTENVRDFRPLLAGALATGDSYAPLLLTTARRHPRHLTAVGALVEELATWLRRDQEPSPEEWL